MFADMSTLVIIEMALKVVAPCVVAFLENSRNPVITGMDPGKRGSLIALFSALNSEDSAKKAAIKQAQTEVKKVQGVE